MHGSALLSFLFFPFLSIGIFLALRIIERSDILADGQILPGFTAGGSSGRLLMIRPFHKLLQDPELLFCAGRDLVKPTVRQDRQILQAPFRVTFVIGFRRRQFHQMTDAPADEITVSFQVSVLTAGCSDYAGDGLRHRGLLSDNKFHAISSLHLGIKLAPVMIGHRRYVRRCLILPFV